jgi:hypothetical protein
MATTDIATGSAAGFMSFMDFMIQKGYGTPGSISLLKSAAKQVFSIVEGEDFDGVDVRSFDIDEYLSRFENRSMGRYTAESLSAYRSRFRKAIESYRSYLADPNWKPAARSTTARRTLASGLPNGKKSDKQQKAVGGDRATKSEVPRDASASTIAYPFPLKSGQIAQLHLPTRLDRDDAERMTAFIRALVFDQPRQFPSGDDGDR